MRRFQYIFEVERIIKICTTKKIANWHQVQVWMVAVVIFVEAQTMSRIRYLLECNGSFFGRIISEYAILVVVRGAQ